MKPEFFVRLREVAGENLSEFARQLGLPQQVVHRYVVGQRKPSVEFLIRIRNVLGIDLNWLLTGSGQPMVAEERAEYQARPPSPFASLNDVEMAHLVKYMGIANEAVGSELKERQRRKKRAG